MKSGYVLIFIPILINISPTFCWTDEDLQLFDLVENTDRKFYDILGVDQKASANEIRKAYRKLSQQLHPDRNKDPNAEEMFRKIAAVSEVLRNEDLRKKYDIILQTGLPDWREPIYYYRRVRNMGLFELIIFLFSLATVGQYLFAWSVYWEKKYEIEELTSSKLRKKTKHQRKGKSSKIIEELEQTQIDICTLPKPRCQDLFPIQFVTFLIHVIKSSPSYLKSCIESIQSLRRTTEDSVEEDGEEKIPFKKEARVKMKKNIEPLYPELNADDESSTKHSNGMSPNIIRSELDKSDPKKMNGTSEAGINEFKKAMKKFPNGTLQRWEKIADYLQCTVPEVIAMTKQLKVQQFSRNVPLSAQGLTGVDDFNTAGVVGEKVIQNGTHLKIQNGTSHMLNGNGNVPQQRCNMKSESSVMAVETLWKQEEQKLLELALQKYSKDTPARWDRIAEFIQSKTKDECIARYKWLAQEIRRKKEKEN